MPKSRLDFFASSTRQSQCRRLCVSTACQPQGSNTTIPRLADDHKAEPYDPAKMNGFAALPRVRKYRQQPSADPLDGSVGGFDGAFFFFKKYFRIFTIITCAHQLRARTRPSKPPGCGPISSRAQKANLRRSSKNHYWGPQDPLDTARLGQHLEVTIWSTKLVQTAETRRGITSQLPFSSSIPTVS